MAEGRFTTRNLMRAGAALGLAALTGLCYFGFFTGTYFSQDDFVWLCFARFFERPPSLFTLDTLAGQFFRPMGQLWWIAVHSVAGANVGPYQVAFLGTHLLNAFLSGRLAAQVAGPHAGRMVMMLMAFSPIFVEPVSHHYLYIFDVLGCTFQLTSLLLVRRAADACSRLAAAGSLIAALAACFSKESYFTLPAIAGLMLGIPRAGSRWQFRVVRAHRWLLASYVLLALAAWAWRWFIIRRFGGYGLADLHTLEDFGAHLLERGLTVVGFTAWSLLPCFSREAGDWMPLLIAIPFLAWMTWRVQASQNGPGAWWCWAWIACAWAPSVTMDTYAAVSYYPAIPAAALLFSQLLLRYRTAIVLLAFTTLWQATHGMLTYQARQPEMDLLKRQEAALVARFAPSEWSASQPSELVLVEGHPDLMPDAAVKYHTRPGAHLSLLYLFNDGLSINWLISESRRPGDLRPLVRSKLFQTGVMQMPPYRAFPMELGAGKLTEHAPDRKLTVLLWEDDRYVEVQPVSGTELPTVSE